VNSVLAREFDNGDSSLTSEMEKSAITLLRQDLTEAEVNVEYVIREIRAFDTELENFLFSLGCYKGETVTLISVLSENFVISVKDARYSIDTEIARAIVI
jgi:Fe2+ transport system protein FeoA